MGELVSWLTCSDVSKIIVVFVFLELVLSLNMFTFRAERSLGTARFVVF